LRILKVKLDLGKKAYKAMSKREFYIVKMRPKGPLHLGEREVLEGSLPLPHADTIFSATSHAWILLYGEPEWLSGDNSSPPPFKISSAFPWFGKKFFLPIPLSFIPRQKEEKKIAYISIPLWERIARGEKIDSQIDVIQNSGKLLINSSLTERVWLYGERPRVGLSLLSAHPGERFFHFGEVWFTQKAGLYFLVESSEEIWKKLQGVFRLIADEGIGGDRTVGCGLFEAPEFDRLSICVPDSRFQMLVSTYYPCSNELKSLEEGYYELIERAGYVYSPYGQSLRRAKVRLFRPGSVFPCEQPRRGKLVDVTPAIFKQHKVFRYGIFMGLPVKLPEEL